jgi:outer membrane protein
MAANETGVTAADLALKGVRAEYAFGLRSTLDILVADESLRAAQLAAARSRSDALIAETALLRATGQLDREAFTGS